MKVETEIKEKVNRVTKIERVVKEKFVNAGNSKNNEKDFSLKLKIINILKFTLTIMIASVTLYSCSDNETIEPIIEMTEAESSAFFKKNMSIFDARVRTLNETSFVKELYLANFSDKSWIEMK